MSTLNCLSRVSFRLLNKMNELRIEKKRLFYQEGMFPTLCKINEYRIENHDT